MGDVNIRLLRQTISQQAAKQIANLADDAIQINFETKKKAFLEAFNKHGVTQEIEAGPNATSSYVSRGNLFSLIGFEQGKNPAAALREFLDERVQVRLNQKKTTVSGSKISIETPVEIPTLKEIDNEMSSNTDTKLEWTDRSWVDLVQRGITGFGAFVAGMFKSPKPSRSGGGIESPTQSGRNNSGQFLGGSVGPIKYVNQLLADLKDSITHGGKTGE